MFYVYTILIPVLIVAGSYLATAKYKPKYWYVDVLLKALFWTYFYTFFLYYLDSENKIDSGWAFVTLITFLMPVSAIIFILKLYSIFKQNWLKRKKTNNN